MQLLETWKKINSIRKAYIIIWNWANQDIHFSLVTIIFFSLSIKKVLKIWWKCVNFIFALLLLFLLISKLSRNIIDYLNDGKIYDLFWVDKKNTKNKIKNKILRNVVFVHMHMWIYGHTHTVIMKYNEYRVTDPKICKKLFTK